MLTKGSFTRDEWDHLLRLLNIMNFSMFFLQPSSFKHKADCHVQESSGKHGQRRFGGGETETDEFGVKNLLSAKKTHSQDSSGSNSPRGIKSWIRVLFHGAPGNRCETTKKDPTAFSQERRRDGTPSSSTRELVRSGESAGSASTRKLVQGDDVQIERTRLEFNNMQVSDHRYRERASRTSGKS